MSNLPEPIIIIEKYNVSKERLWSALTNLAEMQIWYFPMLTSFDLKVGAETKFVVEHEGRVFPHFWTILDLDPPNMISYRWVIEGYPGVSTSTFTLVAEDEDTTILTLDNPVLEPFPQDIPEFSRESGVEGWDYLLRLSLKEYLRAKTE